MSGGGHAGPSNLDLQPEERLERQTQRLVATAMYAWYTILTTLSGLVVALECGNMSCATCMHCSDLLAAL